MKKSIAFTFIIGAVTGSALTAFFAGESVTQILPGEVKVLTKTEYRNIPTETINGDVLEITDENSGAASQEAGPAETVGHDIPEEGMEAIQTQMDRFERSIAAEPETATPIEELPTSVPEEAPPETPAEIIHEDELK